MDGGMAISSMLSLKITKGKNQKIITVMRSIHYYYFLQAFVSSHLSMSQEYQMKV